MTTAMVTSDHPTIRRRRKALGEIFLASAACCAACVSRARRSRPVSRLFRGAACFERLVFDRGIIVPTGVTSGCYYYNAS
ncbi:MAG: hypothetical protein M3P43_16590 [Actinomycetota bacterium]|nr:hypothetical protein [Actinomycetota bacterium]